MTKIRNGDHFAPVSPTTTATTTTTTTTTPV